MLTKLFFPTYSIKLGKMVEGTSLLPRKIFQIGYLKKLFKKFLTNIWKFSKFSIILYSKFVTFHEPHHPCPEFFLPKILHCIWYILAYIIHLYHFQFLNWNFLKIALNFLKIKNLNACSTAPAMFWIGHLCWMSPTCVALLVVWRGYYKDKIPSIWAGMSLGWNSGMPSI